MVSVPCLSGRYTWLNRKSVIGESAQEISSRMRLPLAKRQACGSRRDFELVDLSRLERRPFGVGVDGNIVGADPAVALPVMRGAQPTLGDDAVARLDALGAVLGRLGELLGHALSNR